MSAPYSHNPGTLTPHPATIAASARPVAATLVVYGALLTVDSVRYAVVSTGCNGRAKDLFVRVLTPAKERGFGGDPEDCRMQVARAEAMDLAGVMAEAFHRLWSQHAAPAEEGATAVYVSSPEVCQVLTVYPEEYPGMVVRTVVSGAAMQSTWQACRTWHSAAVTSLQDEYEAKRAREEEAKAAAEYAALAHVVVGTDASRNTYGTTAGWAAAATTGDIFTGCLRTRSIAHAEATAIASAVKRCGRRGFRTIDVLTDSMACYRLFNHPDQCSQMLQQSAMRECAEVVQQWRDAGVVVNIHWVRGHNGHVLNEFADRAAVYARRDCEWRLHGGRNTAVWDRIRDEFTEALAHADIEDLIGMESNEDFHAAPALA
ncbi:RNase H family protein [Corynebacterium phoceense]